MSKKRGIERTYMQLYLDEFCYRFNRRSINEYLFERLAIAAVDSHWLGDE